MSIDRIQGFTTFVRVVEAGSFTGGARLLGTTPSAVSKSIARLERRLGIRLFQRSTRSLALTEEGSSLFERVAPLVRGLEEASLALGEGPPRGRIRVSMPAVLGRALLDPIVAEFLPAHPGIQLETSLGDGHVDLIHGGFDLAIRVGAPADSELMARPLGQLALRLVASPAYLDRAGRPVSASDLARHAHIRYRLAGRSYPLRPAAAPPIPLPAGPFDSDDGEAMRIAALGGAGIAQLLARAVREDVSAGRLEAVLPAMPLTAIPVHALHGYARYLPDRIETFLSFVEAQVRSWQRGGD